jgi:hypothetical protein
MGRGVSATSWTLAVAVACVVTGASSAPAPKGALTASERYLVDPAFRRAELERSLVNPANLYAERRLAAYTEARWGALPEWNPSVLPARRGALPNPNEHFAPLAIPAGNTQEAWLELGRRAFVSYPLQLADYAAPALVRQDLASRYGIYDHQQPGGLVAVKTADGGVHLALTCATCHAKVEGGSLVIGKTNDALRLDRLLADLAQSPPRAWGPGRVDVTADGVDNPTAITDLRPVRFQESLHRTGNVRNGLVPLAIRLETMVITSLEETARPPRAIAMGLALYVWSLGDKLAAPAKNGEGARIFETKCARCHRGTALSGPAVPFDVVRTDEAILLGPERTTGGARVPSLRGVAKRSPLLSSGAVGTLDGLLAPRSERPDGGHTFSQDLSAAEREALLRWLRALE